jgi:hypothetical protein
MTAAYTAIRRQTLQCGSIGLCIGILYCFLMAAAHGMLKNFVSLEQVLEALRERYTVVALDLRAADGVQACDLLGPRDKIRPFFAGADAVIHMAFVPPPSGVSSATTGPGHDSDGGSSADGANDKLFAAEHLNVRMAYNVFQTASEEGVGRVVMASSNHAADYYEELILDRQYDVVDPNAVARSDNYYGWAKIACEWRLVLLPQTRRHCRQVLLCSRH